MGENSSKYSGVDSAIGYLFQFKYALFDSLSKISSGESFLVSIEKLDDIGFEDNDGHMILKQVKHTKKLLSDKSVDLWKTMRIWCEGILLGYIPSDTTFYLVTTVKCKKDSAAYYLTGGIERDPSRALQLLEEASESSKNKENCDGYKAFCKLSDLQKENLVQNIVIVDSIPPIDNLDKKTQDIIRLNVDPLYLDSFMKRLDGFWYRRVIKHLIGEDDGLISSEEIFYEIRDLTDQFGSENLVIDPDILNLQIEIGDKNYEKYKNFVFVHQLKIIGIGQDRILFAIKDYYRAFLQRSRWVDEKLVFNVNLENYETRLKDAWKIRYLQMKDDLGDDDVEKAKIKAAKELYKWIETGNHPLIRSECKEDFIAIGSYHDLADDMEIGWHPDFVERLKAILEPEVI
jgi:hypothetical protein